LRRTPVFTAVALLTLAVAIGANTAIFSIVNGVILHPLDYPRPEQLIYLTTEFPTLWLTRNPLSVQEYLEFRQINQSFAAVGAYRTMGGAYTTGEVNLAAGGRALRVRSISVDADLLNTLGVQPAQGRIFSEEETNRAGGLAPPLAILSYELWQTAFGGQPVLGQAVNVDGRPHEILGIMPSGIDVMDNHTAIWLPLGLPAAIRQNRGFHILHVVGRLKDGVTRQAAQTELNAPLRDWGHAHGSVGPCPHQPAPAGVRPPASDAAVARRDCWQRPPFDLDIASRCRVRSADRLRESREPADGPCRVASSRICR